MAHSIGPGGNKRGPLMGRPAAAHRVPASPSSFSHAALLRWEAGCSEECLEQFLWSTEMQFCGISILPFHTCFCLFNCAIEHFW